MTCCNHRCRQGRDCPARTGVVLPHQAAHQKTRIENSTKLCTSCGMCIGDEHMPRPSEAASINPEAGNVWFVGNEPDDGMPLTPWEAIGFYATVAIGLVASVAIVAGASGWIYGKFFN